MMCVRTEVSKRQTDVSESSLLMQNASSPDTNSPPFSVLLVSADKRGKKKIKHHQVIDDVMLQAAGV